jgi:hypothetical protein
MSGQRPVDKTEERANDGDVHAEDSYVDGGGGNIVHTTISMVISIKSGMSIVATSHNNVNCEHGEQTVLMDQTAPATRLQMSSDN